MSKIVEALREARRWLGDGDLADGMHRDIWTPRYAAAIDMIDTAIAEHDAQPPLPFPAFTHGSAERIALDRLYNEEITVAKCIELIQEAAQREEQT